MEESERKKLLGRQIRRLRQDREKPLTIENLADLADLSRNSIAAIEAGKQNVSVGNLFKIADALGVTPARLFETMS